MSYVRSPLTFVPPQLPSLIDQPPEGHEWLHEVKNDGFRTQLLIERGKARAYTRTGIDWSDRFPGIVLHAARLPCRSAILDGEVVVLDKRGASDFEALQATLRSRSAPLLFSHSTYSTTMARTTEPWPYVSVGRDSRSCSTRTQ